MGSFSLTKAVYLDQKNRGGLLSISNIFICTKALLTWENGFSENRPKYYLYGKMGSVRQTKTLLAWENGSSENRKKYYFHGKMGSLKTDQSIMNVGKWVR